MKRGKTNAKRKPLAVVVEPVVQPPYVPYMKKIGAAKRKILREGMKHLKDKFNARYSVKEAMGQFWIVDKWDDKHTLAMSPYRQHADNIAEALNIWVQLP